ncbi:MAG: histidine kinase, partial [Bacteroidia bacterium]
MRFLSNWLPPIIGSLIWFLFHFLSLSTIGIENESSFKDAVVLTTLLLLILLGLNAMIKLYKPGVVRSLYLIIGNLIISFGIIFLYELIQTKVFESEALLLINLNYPRYLIVALLFVILQTIVFYTWIRESIEERNEAEIRRIKEEELIRQAELNGLRQQFQPHFLFNSLNSIQSLLQFDKDKASEMIQTLADFLRGSVSKNPSSFRKLSEELKHLNLYLEIE